MFFNVIYFNEDLLDRYTSILQPGKNVKYSEVETTTKTGGALGGYGLKWDKTSNSTLSGKLNESSNSKILSFEELLNTTDYFSDFVIGEEYKEFSEISKNMIIKIMIPLYIPEEFDNYEMIEDMKDQLLNPELTREQGLGGDLIKSYMNIKELKIPVYNDEMNKLIFSKLQKNYFEINTEDLDLLENEVTVLAHVKKTHRKPLELFHPVVDLFSFPRHLRREMMKKQDENLKPIIFEGKDGLELDIIAIYD